MPEFGVRGEARVEQAMKLQGNVGILGRIFGRALDSDLIEADPVRALPRDLVVGDRLHVEMTPRQAVHVVRTIRFQQVRLQHRIVRDPGERDTVVGEHVLVILDVLPELRRARILEPGLELREHGVQRELRRRSRVAMRKRHVRGAAGLDRECEAD